MILTHTPYDGTSNPFAIGLTQLDLTEWIEVDAGLETYLAEKDRQRVINSENVFVEEADTRASQHEILDTLTSHLLQTHRGIYSAAGNVMSIAKTNRAIMLNNPSEPPLLTASKLVQEDLCLMRKDASGWRLTAASLCFPSSWSLLEKFGRPMQEIHAPVPGFGPGTRNASLIERMFDNLKPSNPVKRFNWSIYRDGELYHPASASRRDLRPEHAFLRVERQTLRKMPVSGDILFTIRIHLDPLLTIRNHENASQLGHSLAAQLMVLSDDELAYKGLAEIRNDLVKTLNSF